MSVGIRNFTGAVLLVSALTACGGGTQSSAPAASPSPSIAPVAVAPPHPNGPANALISEIGKHGAPVLDATQKAAVERFAESAPASTRPHLRYAIAYDDAGQAHVVVYDGQGLPADGKRPGKKFDYIVFKVLNEKDGGSYDPQQNAYEAPIAPPKERDLSLPVQ